MIDRDYASSVSKQAELVGIARSTVYCLPSWRVAIAMDASSCIAVLEEALATMADIRDPSLLQLLTEQAAPTIAKANVNDGKGQVGIVRQPKALFELASGENRRAGTMERSRNVDRN